MQVATRYDLAELSLVDRPSNPDALGVTFVRGAEPDTDLLDPLPEEPAAEPAAEAGAEPMEARERQPLHAATRTLLAGCACPRCAVALAALAEDDSPEVGDREASGGREGDHEPLSRALLAAMRATTARLASFDATLSTAVATLRADDTRRAAPAPTHDAAAEAEATRVVDELRARVARLEAQPAPGGPAARAVEKTLLGAPAATAAATAGVEYRALEALAGRLRDPQAQLAVAAEMIRLQQGGNRG
ncbi:MAG: hypothetical protein ACHQ1E_09765 [Ktedonobacterales bacterium]